MNVRYRITLTSGEREQLQAMVQAGKEGVRGTGSCAQRGVPSRRGTQARRERRSPAHCNGLLGTASWSSEVDALLACRHDGAADASSLALIGDRPPPAC